MVRAICSLRASCPHTPNRPLTPLPRLTFFQTIDCGCRAARAPSPVAGPRLAGCSVAGRSPPGGEGRGVSLRRLLVLPPEAQDRHPERRLLRRPLLGPPRGSRVSHRTQRPASRRRRICDLGGRPNAAHDRSSTTPAGNGASLWWCLRPSMIPCSCGEWESAPSIVAGSKGVHGDHSSQRPPG